jgi:methionine sulfoxide reductase heme-binding subunit
LWRSWVQRWRKLHRLTALAWLLAIGHGLGAGSDADRWWFLAAWAIVTVPTLGLLASRFLGTSGAAAPRAAAR